MDKNNMIAGTFDDFTKTVINQIFNHLNGDTGQEMTKRLLRMKLEENPGMTVEEWEKCKQEFAIFIFHQLLDSNKDLMSEFAIHTYHTLRGEE